MLLTSNRCYYLQGVTSGAWLCDKQCCVFVCASLKPPHLPLVTRLESMCLGYASILPILFTRKWNKHQFCYGYMNLWTSYVEVVETLNILCGTEVYSYMHACIPYMGEDRMKLYWKLFTMYWLLVGEICDCIIIPSWVEKWKANILDSLVVEQSPTMYVFMR